jgi:hypothetical protein
VKLTGTATPALSITPTTETFANAGPGLPSGVAGFAVKNNSASSVGTLNVALQGTDPGSYVITAQKPACTGQTLVSGGGCSIYVQFAPKTGVLGTQTATLDVNAGANTDVKATLSGTAVATYTVSVNFDKASTESAEVLTDGDGATLTFQKANLGASQSFTTTYFSGAAYTVNLTSGPSGNDSGCFLFPAPYTAANPPSDWICNFTDIYQSATGTFTNANVSLDLYCIDLCN